MPGFERKDFTARHIGRVHDDDRRALPTVKLCEGAAIEQLPVKIFAEHVDARIAGAGQLRQGGGIEYLQLERRHVVLGEERIVKRGEAGRPVQAEPRCGHAASGGRRDDPYVVGQRVTGPIRDVRQLLQHRVGKR